MNRGKGHDDISRAATPIDSATVVLLREGGGAVEVFLMRRHRRQSFMGGAYVFPGGRLDEADCGPALSVLCRGGKWSY
ncbi:MAG TPA: hypothetical protein VM658_20085 [bacterium]|nr:hypothetical protein [bacterium]